MTFFELLDKHLLNKANKTINRLVFAFVIVIMLYIANGIFGFTYYYESKRLDAIEKTANLIKNENIDSLSKIELKKDLKQMASDHAYINHFLRSLHINSPNSQAITRNAANTKNHPSNTNALYLMFDNILYFLLFYLSATFICLIMLTSILRSIRREDNKENKSELKKGSLSIVIGIFCLPILFYLFSVLFPVDYFYIIVLRNAVFQVLSLTLFAAINAILNYSESKAQE